MLRALMSVTPNICCDKTELRSRHLPDTLIGPCRRRWISISGKANGHTSSACKSPSCPGNSPGNLVKALLKSRQGSVHSCSSFWGLLLYLNSRRCDLRPCLLPPSPLGGAGRKSSGAHVWVSHSACYHWSLGDPSPDQWSPIGPFCFI